MKNKKGRTGFGVLAQWFYYGRGREEDTNTKILKEALFVLYIQYSMY